MTDLDAPFAPDWVSPPGDTIADVLEERGWTQAELARRLGYTEKHVSQLINGKAAITEDTASRLERVLGSTAGFWLRKEATYRERLERQQFAQRCTGWVSKMSYLSVCSGIGAASVAWGPLGWQAAAFSEIEPFPCAVLAHHYPDVPNLGDMTTIAQRILNGEVEAPDVLAGGTPCQAFSVAGLRKSLADERGNLTLKFVEIADAIDSVRVRDGRPPAIVFWENVPGVLNTKDNAFGCFLGALAGEDCELKPPGKRWADAGCVFGPQRAIAWRVLDAQYFGLAQRRRRVFVVASAREGFDPAAVLFEFEGVRRDTPPRQEAGQTAPTIPSRSTGGGGLGTDFDCDGGLIHVDPIARCDTAGEAKRQDWETCTFVAFHPTQDPISSSDGSTHALGCGSTGGQASVAVAVALRGREGGATAELGDEVQNCLRASRGGGDKPHVLTAAMQVRRLTPRECERLMGFPDDYTLVPLPLKRRQTRVRWASDSARYKALGNSWAVPVVRWIGERINAAVEQIKYERRAA